MTRGAADESVVEFMRRSGEVGRDMLDVDWAATPLGPIESWPQSLVTVVRVLLTSRFAMWMAWGPELTFLCNDDYRRDTLGRKYPWALGQPAQEVWAEIWPEIGPRITTVIETGEATWDESLMLILERSGYPEETYHTFSYSPLADDDGHVAGMLCVVSEETQRMIGERRMATLSDLGAVSTGVRAETEFLAAAARALGGNPSSLPFTIIYLLDDDGARLAASSGIEAGHPAAPLELRSGEPPAPWPLQDLEAGRPAIVSVTGPEFGRLPTGAWEQPPVEALLLPIPAPGHQRPYGFLVVGLNRYTPLEFDSEYRAFADLLVQHLSAGIAGARSYEAERQRAEQLEELDRAKTAFFSNVSHEFRTPLTLMLGPLEDALTDADGMDRPHVDLVHRNVLRLLKLVNALLDFSRAEAGRMRAEFRPTDVCRQTTELAGIFREATERAGLELIVTCDVPADEKIYVDRDLWERIVLNLISNAFKATLRGRITVEVHPVAGGIELAVSDTGTGIPPDELGHLFQRFHRVRSIARSYEGTGIGLALVKELVDLHGGTVEAESTVGEGSRFMVRIPAGSAHLPADQVFEESLEPAPSIASLFVEEVMSWMDQSSSESASGALRGLPVPGHSEQVRPRVLIADDNADLRRYLTSLLSAQFNVEVAEDGAVALGMIQENPPDLLISDVMMPRLDGYELLEQLRATRETQDLPVILLSARAGEEAAIEGLQAGADDYLPKPFSGRELLARVRAHVDLSALRRQTAADVRAERRRLEQTLRQLPAGVMLAEAPSRRVVFGNEQAAEILGHGILPHVSEGDYDDYRLFTLDRVRVKRDDGPLARAIRLGEVTADEDMLYETPGGRILTVRVSAGPIRDEAGEIVAGVLVFQDVSERVRTERLLTAQRDVLALIAEGVPLRETLGAIVETFEDLSDSGARAAVLLLSADGRHLVQGAAPSLPAGYIRAVDGVEIGPAGGSSAAAAADRGEEVVVTDTLADPLWADQRDLVEEYQLRASWATPIRADDGRLVGTFAVYYDEPREPAREDRRVVDLLTRTAGVAIGRARDAYNRARRLAELQSSLLPRALPDVPGLTAAVSFHPADRGLEVGGDFYDLFPLPDGAWGFVIGDVCGHGAEAAAVTALTRHTTRAAARMGQAPSRVLEIVNEELRESDHDRFCTAQYGRLDPVADGFRLTLACGGHPPPLIRRASGRVEAMRAHGPLLGVFEEAQFPDAQALLHSGDMLVLYTDGLIERNPRLEGEGALRSLLVDLPQADVERLVADLEARALGSPPARLLDDAALLVMRVNATVPAAIAPPSVRVAAA